MIDLDNFKQFNDNYGHQEGDTCLVRIAQKLSELLKRKTDMVARYGGEEFVCVLPYTGIDGAINVAEEFRTGILSLLIPHACSADSYVTISQGVANISPTMDSSPKALLMAADNALYRAKASGRNRICSQEV